MDIIVIKHFLAWSTVLNYAVLLMWFAAFSYGHGWIYRLHARWFKLPVETFDALHYAGMAVYKIGILLFNLVPYFVLMILS